MGKIQLFALNNKKRPKDKKKKNPNIIVNGLDLVRRMQKTTVFSPWCVQIHLVILWVGLFPIAGEKLGQVQ